MPTLTLPPSHPQAPSRQAKALVCEDQRSRDLVQQIERIAPTDATVLITGETGTGKEVVARYLHDCSKRRERTFVGVNCGAFAEQLVESELFGHERGAFTGAASTQRGWFETAHQSSLFLDEVGDLSLALQVKLLRVIQEREVVRLGSRSPIAVDVRLIAATNVDLEKAMAAGHFREDLYYRLSVTQLHLPALRERPGDIGPLAQHFVDLYSTKLNMADAVLTRNAIERLREHTWPGNIRELENVIHHARLVCKGDEIGEGDLRIKAPAAKARLTQPTSPAAPAHGFDLLNLALTQLLEAEEPRLYARVERAIMQRAYSFCAGNQLKTARVLGVSRNVVRARLIENGDLPGTLRGARGKPLAAMTAAEPRAGVPSARTRSAPPVRLPIGYHRFGLLMVAKTLGTLEATLAERNIQIEWTEYAAGPEVVAALQSGEVAFAVVGDCPSVFAQASDAPFVYVGAEAPDPEAAAIVVHADAKIRSVSDLRGRTVVLKRGSNVHYLLIKALEEARVPYEDVRLSFAAPERAYAAFERRQVDAWVIWDPLLSNIQHHLGARVLRDGTGLTHNSAFYLASRGFAQRHPDILDELLAQTSQAADWARQHTEQAAERLSAELDLAPRAVANWLRRYPATRPLSPDLVASQQQIADTLHRLRLLPRPVRVAEASWHRLAG